MPGRQLNPENYRFGYGGNECDNEIKGNGNLLAFGGYEYDTRLGRRLNLDPASIKYPSVSPYGYSNNSPIVLVDKNGLEWVNVHTSEVQALNEALLKKPTDKKLKRQVNEALEKEALVAKYIKEIKENDIALYTFIDQLKIIDKNGNKGNVKVNVSSSPDKISGNIGQTGETNYYNPPTPDGLAKVYYEGNEIVVPLSPDYGKIGFDIVIYGRSSWGDQRLANEAGDVMFYMHYNQDAILDGGNQKHFEPGGKGMNSYLKSAAEDYSTDVEDKYKERKDNGSGKDPANNPYPLEKKKK